VRRTRCVLLASMAPQVLVWYGRDIERGLGSQRERFLKSPLIWKVLARGVPFAPRASVSLALVARPSSRAREAARSGKGAMIASCVNRTILHLCPQWGEAACRKDPFILCQDHGGKCSTSRAQHVGLGVVACHSVPPTYGPIAIVRLLPTFVFSVSMALGTESPIHLRSGESEGTILQWERCTNQRQELPVSTSRHRAIRAT
jgi:hypothetical protein